MSPRKIKVAIYARRSQDEKGADQEDKSTSRQLSNARALAAERGWQVVGEYIDEARSGRNVGRLAQRARMAADAEVGKFTAVIARNVDRLSRDDREGASFVYQLESASVQVWEYSSKQLVDVSNPMTRTMLNMRFGFAAAEAEAASSRTSEQKVDRMKNARLNDGRVLGYENHGDAKKRERRINQEEAELVRRIFQRASEGAGILKIAKELNAAGVPNPTGQARTFVDKSGMVITPKNAKALRQSWSQTTIRGILMNTIYIGQQVYGRTAWCWGDGECSRQGATLKSGAAPTCPKTEDGQKLKHKYNVPESRWLKAERPELRIVKQELWDAAHERLARSRALFLTRAQASGRVHGRPKTEGGMESSYLLSGFLVCADCGGRMMINKRTSKRGRPVVYYVCSTHRTRAGACPVKGSFRATEAHERVIRLFLDKVLTPAALQQAVDALVKKGSQVELLAAQKMPHIAELARLDKELANLTAAIATGSRPEVVLAAIAEREQARKKAAAELANLEKQERVARNFDQGAEEKRLRDELKTWRELLEKRPEAGRAVLRQILHGPIQARWNAETDTWSIYGVATFGGVLHRIFGVTMSESELDEYNRMSDLLNAEIAAGRDPFARAEIAGGSAPHAGSAGSSATSGVPRPSCPRQGSHGKHGILRALPPVQLCGVVARRRRGAREVTVSA
jgi:site-specific DNA recombinase